MCMCLARGRVGGEWMRGLGLGFTNPVGTWGVRDMCLSCGVVCGEWVGDWIKVWDVGWCYVCVCCDYLCRWQVQVSVYCAGLIPAHLRYT